MRAEILLSKKEIVVQFNEVRNLSVHAIMVNRSFLVWNKNGLTKKILNG
jgi:hypothetical protein